MKFIYKVINASLIEIHCIISYRIITKFDNYLIQEYNLVIENVQIFIEYKSRGTIYVWLFVQVD